MQVIDGLFIAVTTTAGIPDDTRSPSFTFNVVTTPSTGDTKEHFSKVISSCFTDASACSTAPFALSMPACAWSTAAWAWAISSAVAPFTVWLYFSWLIWTFDFALSKAVWAFWRLTSFPSSSAWLAAPESYNVFVLS